MPKPITLIQLISEQTMQNLLPVLRLKPARLVHLATPKTAARSTFILDAAHLSGMQPALETVALSAMPAIRETYNAMKAAIQQARGNGQTPAVNFTGGTKLMSIGAYAAALDQKALSIYVDTSDALFVDGRTADGLAGLLEDDFSFTPLRSVLTVGCVAAAHGQARVTGGRDWKPFLPLAQHLLDNWNEEQSTHDALFGPSGLAPGGKLPAQPEEWLPFLDRQFTLPRQVCEHAVKCGLVLPALKGACRLPQKTRPELVKLVEARRSNQNLPDYDRHRIAATSVPDKAISFLTGGWWEVIVAEAAARSGAFRDIRWSAEVGSHGGAILEEDVVALDGVQIVSISCKRGGTKSKLLPLLEEINARAHRLGGSFTRRFLAVYLRLPKAVERNLSQRATDLGIRLLTPSNLSMPNSFNSAPALLARAHAEAQIEPPSRLAS